MRCMDVLIAVDKFKGTLSGKDLAETLAAGIKRIDRSLNPVICPIADGGDGTVDAALAAGYTEVMSKT